MAQKTKLKLHHEVRLNYIYQAKLRRPASKAATPAVPSQLFRFYTDNQDLTLEVQFTEHHRKPPARPKSKKDEEVVSFRDRSYELTNIFYVNSGECDAYPDLATVASEAAPLLEAKLNTLGLGSAFEQDIALAFYTAFGLTQ